MITSDKLRKDAGCWSCLSGKILKEGEKEVEVTCEKGQPEFEERGWQAALTCPCYRMRSFNRLYPSAQRSRE